jgi:hypothetical protein
MTIEKEYVAKKPQFTKNQQDLHFTRILVLSAPAAFFSIHERKLHATSVALIRFVTARLPRKILLRFTLDKPARKDGTAAKRLVSKKARGAVD